MILSDDDKQLIKSTPEKDLVNFHFGLGAGIRNDFGLWGQNKELLESCKTHHADDASSEIIHCLWIELQKTKS